MRSVPTHTPSSEQQQQQQQQQNELIMTESGAATATATITTGQATATMTSGTVPLTDDYSNDLLAYDELIPNTRPEILMNIASKNHLKHALIPVDTLQEIRNM